jgi:type II secretory pathway component PulF
MYDTGRMEQEFIEERLKRIEEKIDRIYASVERTRKYFLWTLIVTAVAFLLPLVGLVFVVPTLLSALSSYTGF